MGGYERRHVIDYGRATKEERKTTTYDENDDGHVPTGYAKEWPELLGFSASEEIDFGIDAAATFAKDDQTRQTTYLMHENHYYTVTNPEYRKGRKTYNEDIVGVS